MNSELESYVQYPNLLRGCGVIWNVVVVLESRGYESSTKPTSKVKQHKRYFHKMTSLKVKPLFQVK